MKVTISSNELDVLRGFLEEAWEHLEGIEDKVLELEENQDLDTVNSIFRPVHTIKGTAAFLGLNDIKELCHETETVLDKVRKEELTVTSDLIDLLLDSIDVISQMLKATEDALDSLSDASGDEVELEIEDIEYTHLVERLQAAKATREEDAGMAAVEEAARQSGTGISSSSTSGSRADMEQTLKMPEVKFPPGLKEQFIEEAEDHIQTIESILLKMEQGQADLDDLNDMFRSLHSLKGNAGVLLTTIEDPAVRASHPLNAFQAKAHELEGLAQRRRDAGEMPSDQEIDLLLGGIDVLRAIVEAMQNEDATVTVTEVMAAPGEAAEDSAGDDDDVPSIDLPDRMESLSEAELEALINTLSQAMEAASKGLDELLDPSKRKDALAKVGRAFEMIIKVGTKMGEDAVAEEAEKSYNIVDFMSKNDEPEEHEAILVEGIREGFSLFDALLSKLRERLQSHSKAHSEHGAHHDESISDPGAVAKAPADSVAKKPDAKEAKGTKKAKVKSGDGKKQPIKVPQERLDKLMNLVGELVVTKNNFSILAREADVEYELPHLSKKIKEFGDTVSRIVDELQATIMSVRMVPVGQIFTRFPRMVRDLSRKLDKKIRLEMSGEETEMDKTIIEVLGDPLVHLIRNSADHGIESASERAERGKPEVGTIWLRAYNKGQSVIIEIEDDGRGIDPNRIKMKALEKGVITHEEIETMTDKEAIMLIFRPGFSTAEQVSEVSGRGVGMDVVKTSIEKIGGAVDMESVLGQGTKVILRLPLTLAISKGLEVEVGGDRFYIPLDYVVETVKAPTNAVHWHRGNALVMIRGTLLQMKDLQEALGGGSLYAKAKEQRSQVGVGQVKGGDGTQEIPLVVLNMGNRKLALKVDSFYNETEFVLKPLRGPLEKLPGFAGATVTGEGDILLVLDPPKLLSVN